MPEVGNAAPDFTDAKKPFRDIRDFQQEKI